MNEELKISNPSQELLNKVFEIPIVPERAEIYFVAKISDLIIMRGKPNSALCVSNSESDFKEIKNESVNMIKEGYRITSLNFSVSNRSDGGEDNKGDFTGYRLNFDGGDLKLHFGEDNNSLLFRQKNNLQNWFRDLEEPQQK